MENLLIPRRAFFYWGGTTMPWIRKKSLESFRQLNPDWEVVLLDETYCPDLSAPDQVVRSDMTRYLALSERGGWYFDTDIVFIRSMDALVERGRGYDTGVCFEITGPHRLHPHKGPPVIVKEMPEWFSIASVFSSPKNPFWRAIFESSRHPESFESEHSMHFGVAAIARLYETLQMAQKAHPGLSFFQIPRKAFHPMSVGQSRNLLRDKSDLEHLMDDEEVFGVHWYGGAGHGKIADGWTEKTVWRDTTLGALAVAI